MFEELRSLYGVEVYPSARLGGDSAVFHGDVKVYGTVTELAPNEEEVVNLVALDAQAPPSFQTRNTFKDTYDTATKIGRCSLVINERLVREAQCTDCTLKHFEEHRGRCCVDPCDENTRFQYQTIAPSGQDLRRMHQMVQGCARTDYACMQRIRNSFTYYGTQAPFLTGALLHATECDTGLYISSQADPSDPNRRIMVSTTDKNKALRFEAHLDKHKEVDTLESGLYAPLAITEFGTGYYFSSLKDLRNLANPSSNQLASIEIRNSGPLMDTMVAFSGPEACLVVIPTTWVAGVPSYNKIQNEPDGCLDLLNETVAADDTLRESFRECCGTFLLGNATIIPCA